MERGDADHNMKIMIFADDILYLLAEANGNEKIV